MEELLELTSKEICEILSVSKDALKKIESRQQLDRRLRDKGYELISKEKVGRSNKYFIKKINDYALYKYM